ncbi:hypothetical protein JGI1_01287 [Candidatus Thermokryptus mobilis]|uniref:S-adenosyl-l-methionine hydroxide adenosyltransferase n=1 Tax=Candidatus Thermokryptus mobilis TaxID=1643428 RepID=A0A0S4N3H1_9BACT|nr:SAM-dependent chlorinase/fluorinase [Candidatus Thermokryptus mobilis]CUU05621.1 hypothetical protein JGI1_01287 [Candidatus Thermokryptus mobilis]
MLIALLTDFGNRDWFVGVMKGVILKINPNVNVVDLSHEVAPQNVKEAGFILWNAYRFFPKGTIFVCVVDPTVGSDRKIIAVQTKEHIFIAPDNGILDFVLSEVEVLKSVYVENKSYFLENISTTFHGRDIFAPVAAYISRGVDLGELGEEASFRKPEGIFVEASTPGDYIGEVIYIDRFGNLITNIKPTADIDGEVKIKEYIIEKISKTYADVKSGQLLALIDSSGLLEIGVRNGNAKELTKADYGEKVFLKVKKI